MKIWIVNFHFYKWNFIESVDIWLEPYLQNITTVKELEALDMYSILLGIIPWENNNFLDTLAPSGILFKWFKYKNRLFKSKNPILAVKIQEMFGLNVTPKILNNSIALQIHL